MCGGRNFTDVAFVNAELDRLHAQYNFDIVIEGDAKGVDRIAGEWARARGIELLVFPADLKGEGRHAALIRNERMLREGKPDLVRGFPGGGGTWYTCSLAEKLGITVVRLA
ncbi:DUF2493 domain-containing protein [Mesorhizobium sp. B2-4-14]|uniref:DUF2493 domain-containing protein n=1 Tax=Mesorhizobium sp. B2-4-14 TaxID=2589935 RepID=UPI0015E2B65F|nr:DUF2493 domain-containing protein [Mesorhizobium sp. B2-4-14]